MDDWFETTRKKIMSGQRALLIAVSAVYRSTSTDALQVITGLLPLDLQTLWEGNRQEHRINNITLEAQTELQEITIMAGQMDKIKKRGTCQE
ncbi:unnamed protein product [Macrosiphum euphorbiae]|uniref:Uncharacterized protein n=1 Tax=Macrosiphum euphorbiae TaxID=13131 RepID=A0AAV0WHD9_9HEMI|nr:unnamed protein product [Macrosiphum euphorbiae]